MRSAIVALIQLLARALDLLDKWERNKHEREMQKERDRAERDPAQYLRDEYGRVPDDTNTSPEADKADDRRSDRD